MRLFGWIFQSDSVNTHSKAYTFVFSPLDIQFTDHLLTEHPSFWSTHSSLRFMCCWLISIDNIDSIWTCLPIKLDQRPAFEFAIIFVIQINWLDFKSIQFRSFVHGFGAWISGLCSSDRCQIWFCYWSSINRFFDQLNRFKTNFDRIHNLFTIWRQILCACVVVMTTCFGGQNLSELAYLYGLCLFVYILVPGTTGSADVDDRGAFAIFDQSLASLRPEWTRFFCFRRFRRFRILIRSFRSVFDQINQLVWFFVSIDSIFFIIAIFGSLASSIVLPFVISIEIHSSDPISSSILVCRLASLFF